MSNHVYSVHRGKTNQCTPRFPVYFPRASVPQYKGSQLSTSTPSPLTHPHESKPLFYPKENVKRNAHRVAENQKRSISHSSVSDEAGGVNLSSKGANDRYVGCD